MAYCPDCGEEVTDQAAFCPSCGEELDSTEDNKPDSDSSNEMNPEATSGVEEQETTQSESELNWRHVGAAIVFAILPAFLAYMMFSIAANNAMVWILLIAPPVFAYLLYQRPTIRAMFGGMCFWLAIEAFLSPLVMLIYTFVFTSQETTTGAGQAGAAIGGTALVIVAFVVGLPLGIVLYLMSRKFDSDG